MWIAFFKIQQNLFSTLVIYIYNYYWIDLTKLDREFCQSFSEKIKNKRFCDNVIENNIERSS